MTTVDFYFDVMCPWAYQTSKWIREVRSERGVEVTWSFFSLEENKFAEGHKHPWERPWSYGWSLLRIAAWMRRGPHGNDAVDRFYSVAGRMIHEDGLAIHTREGVRLVLAELGFDPAVVEEILADESTNEDVLADHRRAVELGAFGVPTLVIDDAEVLFGPVVAPAPTGEEALRLWDVVTGWSLLPNLYELQRPKTAPVIDHIGKVFSPYAAARASEAAEAGRLGGLRG